MVGISSAALQIPLRESRVGAQRLFFARGRAGRAMNRQASVAKIQPAHEIAPHLTGPVAVVDNLVLEGVLILAGS